nr:MAG TPA: hypothetical protein [Caudoviricetes sp.]
MHPIVLMAISDNLRFVLLITFESYHICFFFPL